MSKKVYAVRVGRETGLFTTWRDCEKQVKGYKGAQYKSFPTIEEATQYLYGGSNQAGTVQGKTNKPKEKSQELLADTSDIQAYIDGSFDKYNEVVGYGGVILKGEEKIEFSLYERDTLYTEYWNVSGELLAALYVVQFAIEKGVSSCSLYYDYMGIEMWATGRWKCNNPLTQMYAKKMKNYMTQIRISFYKVKAHTGVLYNERADALAKEGIQKFLNS